MNEPSGARPVKILGLSGSLRKGSYNTALLRVAAEMLPADMTLEIFPLHDIELFNDDVRVKGYPRPVRELRDKVAAADGILFATPEANYSIPGVLKNAIDWLSRQPDPPLIGKPVTMMGASTGGFGTILAQMHLRQICVLLDMRAMVKPEVKVPFAADKFDADGTLTDETTRAFVKQLVAAFPAWIRCFQTA